MYKVRYRNTITQESPQYREWRDKILRNERSLLRVVGFDFNVDHPYTHLLRKIRSLQHGRNHNILNSLFFLFC